MVSGPSCISGAPSYIRSTLVCLASIVSNATFPVIVPEVGHSQHRTALNLCSIVKYNKKDKRQHHSVTQTVALLAFYLYSCLYLYLDESPFQKHWPMRVDFY